MKDFHIQNSFPTIISQATPHLTLQDFLDQLSTLREEIKKILLSSGALIFRGFPIKTADDFNKIITALNFGPFMNYIGGDSPRDKVKDKLYTSTEAPPSLHLPLHQELSYVKTFPSHIYFFCEIAPPYRGETIIADARKVYQALNHEVKNTFKTKEINYISHYYYRSIKMSILNHFVRSHKSWVEVFETQHKNEVEKICNESDIQFKWLKNDWLEMKQKRPAVLEHPLTKEEVWFNQAHLFDFNPKLLGRMRYIGAKLFYLNPKTRLHDVTFADGTKIPRADLYHILDVLEANTVAPRWQQGDVMILDNILTMHGRNPFKGSRRILTAMTGPPGL